MATATYPNTRVSPEFEPSPSELLAAAQKRLPLHAKLLRIILGEARVKQRVWTPGMVAYLGYATQVRPYKVTNISACGFYIETPDRWIMGEDMPLRLQMPDPTREDGGEFITVHATVRRLDARGVGFSFGLSKTEEQARRGNPAPGTRWVTESGLLAFLQLSGCLS